MSSLDQSRWIDLNSVRDHRGILTAVEASHDIPFEIKRIFYMHHIVADRAGHAHTDTHQLVVAAHGSFKMDLSDATATRTFEMNDPCRGVYMPPMVFVRIYDLTPDAVCLVLASTHYDMSKSIRTWEDFKTSVGRKEP